MFGVATRQTMIGGRATPASIPAPVKGWNARDSLGEMDPLNAVYLKNLFPSATDVALRNGYTQHATGISGEVESLLVYAGNTANQLFACAGAHIYEVTASGAVGAAVVTGLTNARWQFENIATPGGNYLLAFNGEDDGLLYDGSSWTTVSITGVASTDIIGVTLFKNRLWLTPKDGLIAYYLGTNSIAGTASPFPIQSIASAGGYLNAIGTWTGDGGYGMDDMLVFATSKGQIIIYNGLDPATASTWQLTGVWQYGAPVGRRCFLKYGGDLLFLSLDGLMPLSSTLKSSRTNPNLALSAQIMKAVSDATALYQTNFGWQLCYFPKANMLLLNVPVDTGAQQQYVMNTITNSWCQFTNWFANCWALFNDEIYFGSAGFVGHAWNGASDAGSNIDADGKQAFNYFKNPGILKRWTMMRPIIATNGFPGILAAINIDFSDEDITTPINFNPTFGSFTWDLALWDSGIWGGAPDTIQRQWQGINGVGYCCAIRLKVVSQGIDVRWISTDLMWEPGAIL